MMMALHIWSMSHGIASLFARGDAARRPLPMSPEELLEAGRWFTSKDSACGAARSERCDTCVRHCCGNNSSYVVVVAAERVFG